MRVRAGNIAIAFELLAVGSLLIYSYWINKSVDFSRSWPVLLILVAIPLLIQHAFQQNKDRAGILFIGILFLLTGIFFLFFSLTFWGLDWIDLKIYWPYFLIIPGLSIAFVSTTDEAHLGSARLIANGLLATGFIALIITLALFRSAATVAFMDHWPLMLVPVLLYFLGFFKPSMRADNDA